ncbi:PAS domain S-box protein [Haloarcula sp. CBA1130]|uniref:PAS domain-containing protein n=1 Tax=unclassified Haloarcula TaxID=2624677 RepID=UPI001246BA19|nr:MULTISPECIES: PAS domain-containing protein [unclassified Haloarcula]KAA9396756.1 PAS domain S-box protein [Haloarcula sp. CBA1129]KAA9401717.1 PAS domain S-box protein [Haloarcula sp. CBA1130]
MADTIRVLHVDDTQGFAEMAAEYLERAADDLTVVTETRPETALARLDDSFDCVVSDYEMPERNGLELFHQVRNRYPDLPFMLFTGKGNESVASEAITAGVTDYLQKDGSTDQYTVLANRIRNAVERRRARRERERSERRFEAVFQDPQTLVGVLDPDGTVRKANQTALEAVDASRETVIGQPFWELSWWPDGHSAEVQEWVDRAAAGEYVEIEIDHTRIESTQFSYHGYIRPVRDDNGDIVSLVASGHDVTGKKERTEKLERTRDLLSQTEQLASVGGWEIDVTDGPPYEGNPTAGFYHLHGLDPDEHVPVEQTGELLHPEDRRQVKNALSALLTDGEPFDVEARIVTPDGETRWVRSMGVPVGEASEFSKCRGAMVDITDQKRQAAELERTTDLLRHTQQIADVGGWELDISEPPYEATWTDQLFEIFEIPPRDPLTPEDVLSFVHPDDHDRVAAETERLIAEGEGLTQEYRIMTGEGKERWLRVISEQPEHRDDIIRGATLDITDQKQTTRALKERERTLRQHKEFTDDILDAVDDVFFLLDENGRVRRWNKPLERVTGYPGDTLSSMDGEALFRAEDCERVSDAFRTGDTTLELPLVNDDGEPVPYEFIFDRVKNPAGETRVAAIGRDISARKEREETLARANRQLQTILETTTALVFVKDSDGRYQRINQRFREIFLEGAIDAVGKTDAELFPEQTAERFRADDREVIETGKSIEREEEVPTTDGTRTFLTLKNPIYDDEGTVTGICGIATDITERAEYKAHVERQKERLDEFASIVSHDLRNPLDVAMGRTRLAKADQSGEHLPVIERSLNRMQELIDDLLTLARQGESVAELQPVAIGNAVEQAWRSVQTGTATLEADTEDPVVADPTRLQQLFENLIRNSIEHGTAVSTEEAQEGDVTPVSNAQTKSETRAGMTDDSVTVSVGDLADSSGFYVADDGTGIPEDEREEVLRSGYSTSEDGTGFGLAIVREIAEAHDWTVTVTESADGGARFEFRGVDTAE